MRPLRARALPTDIRESPLPLMLSAAYGGYCFTCEKRIDAEQYAVDARTGRRARHVYDPASWPHLLLLCRGCWLAHEQHLPSYRPGELRLPYDDYRTAVEPNAEFVYRMTPVVVRMVDGDDVVHESEQSVVVVSGTTDPARRTVEHFELNGPHYADGVVMLPVDDTRLHRDGRLRARSTAWSTGAYVGDALLAGSDDTSTGRLVNFRQMLVLAGCWSTAMTAVWARLPDPSVIRALFDGDHPGVHTAATLGTHASELAGHLDGNVWAGTSPAFFDRLQSTEGP